MASRQQLLEAARAVITALQRRPELREAKVTIIGGVALQTHAPNRATEDVDVLIFGCDVPAVRALLVSLFPRNLEKRAQPMFFTGNSQNFIQVDIIPPDLPPYLPADAATLGDVNPNHLPFLGPLDLLVYKVHCCSMRPSRVKRTQDAEDACDLVNMLSRQRPIALDDTQKQAVLSGLDEMLEYSRETREWWESALGLSD